MTAINRHHAFVAIDLSNRQWTSVLNDINSAKPSIICLSHIKDPEQVQWDICHPKSPYAILNITNDRRLAFIVDKRKFKNNRIEEYVSKKEDQSPAVYFGDFVGVQDHRVSIRIITWVPQHTACSEQHLKKIVACAKKNYSNGIQLRRRCFMASQGVFGESRERAVIDLKNGLKGLNPNMDFNAVPSLVEFQRQYVDAHGIATWFWEMRSSHKPQPTDKIPWQAKKRLTKGKATKKNTPKKTKTRIPPSPSTGPTPNSQPTQLVFSEKPSSETPPISQLTQPVKPSPLKKEMRVKNLNDEKQLEIKRSWWLSKVYAFAKMLKALFNALLAICKSKQVKASQTL